MEKDQIEFRLGKNLRSLIKERGMTVVAVSSKTGIPLQTLHGWLAGVCPRRIWQVKIVAEYFGLTLDELCYKEGSLSFSIRS